MEGPLLQCSAKLSATIFLKGPTRYLEFEAYLSSRTASLNPLTRYAKDLFFIRQLHQRRETFEALRGHDMYSVHLFPTS